MCRNGLGENVAYSQRQQRHAERACYKKADFAVALPIEGAPSQGREPDELGEISARKGWEQDELRETGRCLQFLRDCLPFRVNKHHMSNAFILSACRTPIGKFRGSLSWLSLWWLFPGFELAARRYLDLGWRELDNVTSVKPTRAIRSHPCFR